MEVIWIVCAGTAIGFVGSAGLAVGFIAGIGVHGYLASYYKRSVNEAIGVARNQAYADYMKELKEARERKTQIEARPGSLNKYEAAENIDASLARVYPLDKELQERARMSG